MDTILGAGLTNTHAAPTGLLSTSPPTMAAFPSADIATDHPWFALPPAPVPTSLALCWLHTPPLLMYTHAAPTARPSLYPPTMAVLPSAESATDLPWFALPPAPVPTSLAP